MPYANKSVTVRIHAQIDLGNEFSRAIDFLFSTQVGYSQLRLLTFHLSMFARAWMLPAKNQRSHSAPLYEKFAHTHTRTHARTHVSVCIKIARLPIPVGTRAFHSVSKDLADAMSSSRVNVCCAMLWLIAVAAVDAIGPERQSSSAGLLVESR
jgi:hypothetical protein